MQKRGKRGGVEKDSCDLTDCCSRKEKRDRKKLKDSTEQR